MPETDDPCSPEILSSSGIAQRNNIVALRARGRLRRFQVSGARDITAETDDVGVRDRDLREFCCRLFGWSDERANFVDDVMDVLLTAVAQGAPIALRAASDPVPIAYALHRRLLGAERPFVVCDPRRCEGEGSVRLPASRRNGLIALHAAMNGSLCLRSNRLPADFDMLTRRLRNAVPPATIFVCLHDDDRVRDLICRPLEIPSLAERASEADRIVQGTFDEAAETLGVKRVELSSRMRQCVVEHVASFVEVEKTALRLLALASAQSPSQAAQRLHMAPVSLIRWLGRRRWTEAVLRNLESRSQRRW